jgi:molecular chaperone DnaK (HSP70)
LQAGCVAISFIRNNDGEEVTPSVVMIDKKERLLVGQAA